MVTGRRARQVFVLHRWTGLLTGSVICFLSLTGTALVFKTELDRALNRALLVSHPAGRMISPDRALTAVRTRYPGAAAWRLELPETRDGVYTVFADGQTGGRRFTQVLVDPYSARIRGTRVYQHSFAFVLRQLHLRFFAFGWQGRVVVGCFGLLLLVSTLSGFLVHGRFIRALPHWWSIRRERGLQIGASDWHKLVGIVALAFNVVIAFTGAVLGLENLARYSPPVARAIHPGPARGSVPAPPATLEHMVPLATALARATAALPDLRPRAVNLPLARRSHYLVQGDLRGRIAMHDASEVGVNALTGEVFYTLSARRAPAITRAYDWMDPLHFGYWGGTGARVLYLVLGLSTAFLSITGILVWYLKTFRRSRARAFASPRSGMSQPRRGHPDRRGIELAGSR